MIVIISKMDCVDALIIKLYNWILLESQILKGFRY